MNRKFSFRKIYGIFYLLLYLLLIIGNKSKLDIQIWQNYFPLKIVLLTFAYILSKGYITFMYPYNYETKFWISTSFIGQCLKASIFMIISLIVISLISNMLNYKLYFLFF
jgi:hypothetical protein